MNVNNYISEKRKSLHNSIKSQKRLECEMKKVSEFFEALDDKYVEKIFAYEGGYKYDIALFITARQDYFKKVENIVGEFWNIITDYSICPLRGHRHFCEYTGKMDYLQFCTSKNPEVTSIWKIEISALPDTDCRVSREEIHEEITSYKYKMERLNNCL